MSQVIENYQKKVLKTLSGRMGEFYLVGGTALSLYYFDHRESQDLDFFTQSFSKKMVEEIVGFISAALKKKITLKAQQSNSRFVKMAVYAIPLREEKSLKVDFVEDYAGLIRPLKTIDGIKVASLEDIYIRKIYAITGTAESQDLIGRKITIGSRQEAKDFFDLYCLSHTFLRLSEFSFKYCGPAVREGVVRWFRTYSRLDMKTGLMELSLRNPADYNLIERHFNREINRIIDREVDIK